MSYHEYWRLEKIVSCGKYPFSIGQLRNLLLFRHRNGLQEVVFKVGKRLVFRVDLWELWLENRRGSK